MEPDYYEHEDRDALVSEFVQLWATFPKFSAQDVALQVFRNRRDHVSRALQAANVWASDLSIMTAVRDLKSKGVVNENGKTKEEYLAQVEAAYSNPDITNAQVKALELEGKARGFIDGATNNVTINQGSLLKQMAELLPS